MPIPPLPVDQVRARFAALERGDTVYLDNAAGAQLPDPVLVRTLEAMTEMQVNKGAAYAASRRVTEAKERVRSRTAEFLGASAGDVAFGANATTLVTLAAASLAETIRPGDEIVVSGLDHHANVDPWRRLEHFGATVRTWRPRGSEARLELGDLDALLGERTRLVAVTAASNALGSYTPVGEICRRVHAAGALAMIDAVHFAPHRLPEFGAWNADLLVFSPYKVVGPHLGVLAASERARSELAGHPLAFFGAGRPADAGSRPIDWEPGTQNHEAILGWGGALAYLDEVAGWLGAERGRSGWRVAYDAFEAHERALLERLLPALDELGYERYGLRGAGDRTATVALNHPAWSAPELARFLAERGVAVAAGHYYAFDLMTETLDLAERGGAVRVSALHYTSHDDLDRLLAALGEARESPRPADG